MAVIKENLKPIQIMTITVSTLLGVNIFTVQHELVVIAGQDMWLSAILGGLLAYAGGLSLYYLAKLYPKSNLPEIFIQLGGKIIGRIILIPFMVYVLLYGGLSLRIFTQVTRVFLLDRTPTYAIVLLMCVVVVYVVNKNIYTISNVIDLLFPVFMGALVLFIFITLRQADIYRIEPILFENTRGVIDSIIPAYQAFSGYGIIAYILCYMQTIKKTFKWYTIGMTVTTILISASVLVTLLNFGPDEIKTMVYPFLALSKTIEFSNTLVERLEGFMVIIWIPVTFITITVFTFASVRNFVTLLSVKPKYEKFVVYAHLPLLAYIGLYSRNSLEALKYFDYTQVLATYLGLIASPALLIIALIKTRREKHA